MALSKITGISLDSNIDLVSNSLTVDTNTLVVDETNNRVGIGTSSPATSLDVAGKITSDGLTVASDDSYAIDVSRPSAGNTTLRITSGSTAGNDAIFRADIGNTTGSSGVYFGDSDTNGIGRIMYEHNGDYMRFYTVSAERMRITSDGNVGIGTSSPSTSHRLTLDKPTNYGGIEFKQAGTRVGQIIQDGIGNLYVDANSNNDGGSLYLRNNYSDSLVINSNGIVTKPNQPAFWAYCTADTNINVSSGTPVEFNAERFDVGSNFDTSTYTFTAPVTGKYFFSAGCRIDLVDTAASYYRLRVITSNQELSTIFDPNFSADLNYQTHQLASMFDMDAGDTASVNILQSAGHTSSHVNSNINYTWFTGYLLG